MKCNSVFLGVFLNFSVFQYEIMGAPTRAVALARGAFEAALARLDSLDASDYALGENEG